MNVLIAGCGFLGGAAAGFFSGGGARVLGLCLQAGSPGRYEGSGFEVRVADISQGMDLGREWERPDILVHCASSGRGGVEAYEAVYREGIKNLLRACRPGRTIFVGSTSVYGQTDGGVVDEESPAEPVVATGRVLLEAEGVALGVGGCVLRLSALYGPGRSVLMRKFLDGTARIEGERWVNQIHRDDAARAVVHAAAQGLKGIFNVTDNRPALQREVYGWIAARLGGALPAEGTPASNRKRGLTNKRVGNAKLRATGWEPVYPDFEAALLAGAVSASI